MPSFTISALVDKVYREVIRLEKSYDITPELIFELAEKVVYQNVNYHDFQLLVIFANLKIPIGKMVEKYGEQATMLDIYVDVLISELVRLVTRDLDEPEPPDSHILGQRPFR